MKLTRHISICLCLTGIACALATADDVSGTHSAGTYRLPFADGTVVKVFDDFTTHRPIPALDLFAVEGHEPYRVVAAADGRVMAIQDSYGEQQSLRDR